MKQTKLSRKMDILYSVLIVGTVLLVLFWRPVWAVTVYTAEYAANEVVVLFKGNPPPHQCWDQNWAALQNRPVEEYAALKNPMCGKRARWIGQDPD